MRMERIRQASLARSLSQQVDGVDRDVPPCMPCVSRIATVREEQLRRAESDDQLVSAA